MHLMPNLGLGTDIMVGFPGETETHFETSRRFVEKMPFSYLHVFSYSDRPKTAANYFDDKCHPTAIRERSAVLHDLAVKKKGAFYASHIGRTEDVLFEMAESDGLRKGFTRSYVRVGVEKSTVQDNQLVPITIGSMDSDLCRGRLADTA